MCKFISLFSSLASPHYHSVSTLLRLVQVYLSIQLPRKSSLPLSLNLIKCASLSLYLAPSQQSLLNCCHHFLTITIFLFKITNRSFHFASRHLWNQQLPASFRQSYTNQCPSLHTHTLFHSCQLMFITATPTVHNRPSVFHSRLKTYHFGSPSYTMDCCYLTPWLPWRTLTAFLIIIYAHYRNHYFI